MKDLIEAARSVQGTFFMSEDFRGGAVGAAVRTSAGNVYTGISLEMACGIGFCAEHSAIAEMLKNRETKIEAMVAVSPDGVIPPCGRCRELVLQVDPENAATLVGTGNEETMRMSDLLPRRWY
ncbi:MAG: cytidine deaminase [Bacillota bacterium]